MIFSTDAIADFEALLGSSARKTVQWTVFSENGLASPGGKSRNLQVADVGKGAARCAAVLRGISLIRQEQGIEKNEGMAYLGASGFTRYSLYRQHMSTLLKEYVTCIMPVMIDEKDSATPEAEMSASHYSQIKTAKAAEWIFRFGKEDPSGWP